MKNSIFNTFVIVRRMLYLILAVIDKLYNRENSVFVLCYHSINNDNWRFSVDIEEFKKQVEFLLKRYQSISLSDLYGYLADRKKLKGPSFVITFDDGYRDIIKIKSFLKIKHIKPAVFVLGTSYNKINWKTLGTRRQLLSSRDINNLQKSGWEIGYHGLTHTILTQLNGSLKEEILSPYKYFAYPKGRYSRGIISFLRKTNYKLAMSMDDSIISRETNPYIIPRIGVDGTHNFNEFKTLASPSVVKFRSLIKRSFLERYL